MKTLATILVIACGFLLVRPYLSPLVDAMARVSRILKLGG